VLVDEYQDIEPAQELLVRMLAAPQDDLFAVGDEDQTLYGWRRASVRRIVDLDARYPSLERHALAHNYRCTPEVVDASSRLIAHNRLRFPKTIKPTPGRPAVGRHAIRVAPFPERDDGDAARMLAKKLARHKRGEIVVLARTVNALRPYALEAAAAGLRLAGPEELFESSGAVETLQAYFAVCTDPSHAREQHVRIILRRPSRGSLGVDAAQKICACLHRGLDLPAAVEALPATADARWRVTRAAGQLATLATVTDAAAFIARLRQDGLDRHFEQVQEASARPDRDDLRALAEAEEEAKGQSLQQYAGLLAERQQRLHAARDETHGLELTTVHRAKGREWPRVVLVRADENTLPHANALAQSAREPEGGEGLEAERRIAYIAFTRAQSELSILHTTGRQSRFLYEAGLVAEPARATPHERQRDADAGFWHHVTRTPVDGPKPDAQPVSTREHLERAREIGLHHVLSTIADLAVALDVATLAIAAGRVGPPTRSERLTVRRLLGAIGALTESEREDVRRSVAALAWDDRIADLPEGKRDALGRALKRVPRKRRPHP
jgi:DNA helicase-2/ATP-dependent DNA helicase PcrA